jgi:transposase
MHRGRPLEELTVTAEEQATLTGWTRRPTTAQALAVRARIVLGAAEGRSNKDIAATLRITEPTVGKWRRRFLAGRLDGLLDEPRPGAPRTIADADVERVIALTLESAPRDATHWSTRSMAAATGYSQSSISRIWRAFALAPHRSETFKLSTDPLFIEKVRDIVGLYLAPPARAHPRLGAPWHDEPVRRPRRGDRPGDRRVPPAPPGGRIPRLPRPDRDGGSTRPRGPRHPRQRQHPQDAAHPALARQPPPLPPPLHAHQRLLAQPRRAVLRAAHREAGPPRRPSQHRRARARDPRLPRHPQ